MTRGARICLSACVIGFVTGTSVSAQSFRTIAVSRLMSGTGTLDVNVEFAAGTLWLAPGDERSLYTGELYYDEGRFVPLATYDGRIRRLDFGLHPAENSFNLGRTETPQRLSLTIAPQVPVDLTITLGAAHAEIELGGLTLSRAEIGSGAAKAHLTFTRPNRTRCGRLVLKTGAAEFTATGLGNSRCSEIRFAGGVGDVLLDFSGEWKDVGIREAEVNLGLGQVTLRLPRGIGVAITVDRFLASFDRAGLEKVGSEYRSADYAGADAKLHITIKAVLGDIGIEWVEQ